MYEELYEYIFNVHFKLIPLSQCLFVFDCNNEIVMFKHLT